MNSLDLRTEHDASAADAAYFVAHPAENERVRLAVPGELGATAAWIRVVQLAPGVRVRAPWVTP